MHVTDKFPYVDCVTYKKWKPLGRVGMIVMSELGGKRPSASYKLTRESEDGTISFYNDKKIDSILSHRKQLLRCFFLSYYSVNWKIQQSFFAQNRNKKKTKFNYRKLVL